MKDFDSDNSELLEKFTEGYIGNFAFYLREMTKKFIENRKLEGKIYVDEALLEQCLIDTLYDIKRLRDFHDISQENSIKLHAYTVSWFLRRKPLQKVPNCTDKLVFINELFAMDFLISALREEKLMLNDADSYNQEKAKEIPQHLFYHLKYRDTHPQVLELFLVGLSAAKKKYIAMK